MAVHKTKTFRDVDIKADGSGEFSAVFSTFDTIDLDGDVTLQGAFTEGEAVRISAYGHESWMGALPVGRGAIRTTDREAIVDGKFFLDTTSGRDTYEVVKGMADLQEWSYGFDILERGQGEFEGQDVQFLRKLKVHEVSPVLLGAGIATRTLAVKGLKDASTDDLVAELIKHDPTKVAHAIAGGDLKLTDHLATVLTAVKAIHTRLDEVTTLRAEQGKSLGQESHDAASNLADELESACKSLREVLTSADGPGVNFDADVQFAQELARTRL